MCVSKTRLLTAIILLTVTLAVPGAQAQRKKQIAVLNFDFTTVDIGLARHAYGGQENLAITISDKLMNNLISQKTSVVIERSKLESVLREQNLGINGRVDPSTAARVGSILGADAIIIGSVSAFDIHGLPKDTRDVGWTPDKLRARITVNYRIVNTTTSVAEHSGEMTGISSQEGTDSNSQRVVSSATGAIDAVGNIIGNNSITRIWNRSRKSNEPARAKDEDIRRVVELAVGDVVNQVTVGVESYLAGSTKHRDDEKEIRGRVIDTNGPTVFITGIDRAAVRIGERLYVRRARVKTDPVTGKQITLTDKIGEVEIVELQDEYVVGSFSGSITVKDGDLITNSLSAVSAPTRQNQSPTPSKNDPPASKSRRNVKSRP